MLIWMRMVLPMRINDSQTSLLRTRYVERERERERRVIVCGKPGVLEVTDAGLIKFIFWKKR